MISVEENAKKIEMLTRVARLLGDQIREQSKKIDSLQEEISRLKKELVLKHASGVSSLSQTDKVLDPVPSSAQDHQESSQPIEVKQLEKQIIPKETSEKEELMNALKIIDNL